MNKQFVSKFLKSSFTTSVGSFSTIFFHFFSISIIVRYTSKEEFGIYALVLVIVQFFKIISGLGLDLTLVKFLSDEDKQADQDTVTSIILIRLLALVIISGITYLAGNIILPLFGDDSTTALLFYIPILFSLASLRELFFHLMQGLQQFNRYAIVQISSAIFKLLLVFILLNHLNLLTLIYIEISMLAASLFVQLLITSFRPATLFSAKINTETWRRVIKFGLPLYYNSILNLGLGNFSIFLIGIFLNPISVAAFEVSRKIPMGFRRIFQSFIVVYFPNISKLFSQGKREDAQKLMNLSLVLFSSAITFVALISFLFRQEIVTFVFSEKYVDVSLAFALLMLNINLRVISTIMGYSLVSAGHPSDSAKVNTVAVIVNMAGSLIMIPIFGYIGAVYAMLIMNVISVGVSSRFLFKAAADPDIIDILKPVFILGCSLGIYYLVGNETFITKFLTMIIYIPLCIVFIRDTRETLRYLLKYGRKFKWQFRPI